MYLCHGRLAMQVDSSKQPQPQLLIFSFFREHIKGDVALELTPGIEGIIYVQEALLPLLIVEVIAYIQT